MNEQKFQAKLKDFRQQLKDLTKAFDAEADRAYDGFWDGRSTEDWLDLASASLRKAQLSRRKAQLSRNDVATF